MACCRRRRCCCRCGLLLIALLLLLPSSVQVAGAFVVPPSAVASSESPSPARSSGNSAMEVLKEPDASASASASAGTAGDSGSSIIAPIPSSSMEGDENLGSQVIRNENYDTVKVDLAGGRDYPIYIGTGYADEEGAFFFGTFLSFLLSFFLSSLLFAMLLIRSFLFYFLLTS